MPKQLYFEGMDMEEYPIRFLYKPSDQELSETEEMLGQYKKTSLQLIMKPFIDLMQKFRFRYKCADGSTEKPDAVALLENSKNNTKAEWQQILAPFFNEKNYLIAFEAMPEHTKTLCREVLRKHFLAQNDVNKIMGKNCFEKDESYGSYWFDSPVPLKKPLNCVFSIINGTADKGHYKSWDDTTYLYIDTLRQQMLLRCFFPDLIELKGLDSLPGDNQLKQYCGENFIFAKLPLLETFHNSGLLPYGYSKLTASAVKKTQSMLAIPDFFDTYPEKKQASLSATLLLNIYQFFRAHYSPNKIQADPNIIIKSIFYNGFEYNSCTLPVLLPYMRGIKKSQLDSANFNFVVKAITSILKTHHDKKWLPIDSLLMNIRTFDVTAEEQFLLINASDIDYMHMYSSYNSDREIHLYNMVQQLSEPFVKALFFALSTFGFVEIAYREPQKGDTSYYDGLQYVRLTELGKYALGLSESYTPPKANDEGPTFELNDQRLLIKVVNSASPFITMLKEFAVPVTPSLYRVDYETFLTDCSRREHVKHKTDMFKQYICKDLPPVWKQFFDEMLSRCAPFSAPKDSYMLLSLPPENATLAHLLLTEPSLRRYVHKVEGYMILVKKSEIKKFTEAMKRFGYII